MKKHVVIGIIIIFAILAYLWLTRPGPSSANTPEEMFSHILLNGNPIPTEVRNIKGVGDTWQGYSIWLRFEATEDFIESLIARGYEQKGWQEIGYRFNLPEGYDRFDGLWKPSQVDPKECYERYSAMNAWGNGTHFLLIDRKNRIVYFYGIAP